jgi:hypothetical protein
MVQDFTVQTLSCGRSSGVEGKFSNLRSLGRRHNGKRVVLPTMTHTLLLDPQLASTQEAFHASLTPDLADQLDQVMQRDRAFFLQHPDQDYYVRPITPVEVLEGQALGKEVHDNARVLVGEVVPGSRIRLTILDDLPPPVEEFRTIQQQLRHEMRAKAPTLKDRIQYNQKARPKAKGFGTKKEGRSD